MAVFTVVLTDVVDSVTSALQGLPSDIVTSVTSALLHTPTDANPIPTDVADQLTSALDSLLQDNLTTNVITSSASSATSAALHTASQSIWFSAEDSLVDLEDQGVPSDILNIIHDLQNTAIDNLVQQFSSLAAATSLPISIPGTDALMNAVPTDFPTSQVVDSIPTAVNEIDLASSVIAAFSSEGLPMEAMPQVTSPLSSVLDIASALDMNIVSSIISAVAPFAPEPTDVAQNIVDAVSELAEPTNLDFTTTIPTGDAVAPPAQLFNQISNVITSELGTATLFEPALASALQKMLPNHRLDDLVTFQSYEDAAISALSTMAPSATLSSPIVEALHPFMTGLPSAVDIPAIPEASDIVNSIYPTGVPSAPLSMPPLPTDLLDSENVELPETKTVAVIDPSAIMNGVSSIIAQSAPIDSVQPALDQIQSIVTADPELSKADKTAIEQAVAQALSQPTDFSSLSNIPAVASIASVLQSAATPTITNVPGSRVLAAVVLEGVRSNVAELSSITHSALIHAMSGTPLLWPADVNVPATSAIPV